MTPPPIRVVADSEWKPLPESHASDRGSSSRARDRSTLGSHRRTETTLQRRR